jgi:hypothetical protein
VRDSGADLKVTFIVMTCITVAVVLIQVSESGILEIDFNWVTPIPVLRWTALRKTR